MYSTVKDIRVIIRREDAEKIICNWMTNDNCYLIIK